MTTAVNPSTEAVSRPADAPIETSPRSNFTPSASKSSVPRSTIRSSFSASLTAKFSAKAGSRITCTSDSRSSAHSLSVGIAIYSRRNAAASARFTFTFTPSRSTYISPSRWKKETLFFEPLFVCVTVSVPPTENGLRPISSAASSAKASPMYAISVWRACDWKRSMRFSA